MWTTYVLFLARMILQRTRISPLRLVITSLLLLCGHFWPEAPPFFLMSYANEQEEGSTSFPSPSPLYRHSLSLLGFSLSFLLFPPPLADAQLKNLREFSCLSFLFFQLKGASLDRLTSSFSRKMGPCLPPPIGFVPTYFPFSVPQRGKGSCAFLPSPPISTAKQNEFSAFFPPLPPPFFSRRGLCLCSTPPFLSPGITSEVGVGVRYPFPLLRAGLNFFGTFFPPFLAGPGAKRRRTLSSLPFSSGLAFLLLFLFLPFS